MYAYLWDRLNQLQQEIDTLRQENEAFSKKLAELEPLRIERIEYKVQELHVETLSGTLDIGMTVKGDEKSIARIIEQMKQDNPTLFQFGEKKGVEKEAPETADIEDDEEGPQSGDHSDHSQA